jgi:hypothetical protein
MAAPFGPIMQTADVTSKRAGQGMIPKVETGFRKKIMPNKKDKRRV